MNANTNEAGSTNVEEAVESRVASALTEERTRREESSADQQSKRRSYMEIIMAIATVLSAAATMVAVGVGYIQYQTAHEALSAADRNRVFESYAGALSPVCAALEEYRSKIIGVAVVGQMMSNKNDRQGSPADQTLAALAGQTFDTNAQELGEALEPLSYALSVSLQRLKIWAKAEEERGIEELERFQDELNIFNTGSLGNSLVANYSDVWGAGYSKSYQHCHDLQKILVPWFRGEVDFRLKPVNLNFKASDPSSQKIDKAIDRSIREAQEAIKALR